MHNSLIEDKYTVQYLPCNNNKTTTSSSCFKKGAIFSDIAIRTESIIPNCKSINNQTGIVRRYIKRYKLKYFSFITQDVTHNVGRSEVFINS